MSKNFFLLFSALNTTYICGWTQLLSTNQNYSNSYVLRRLGNIKIYSQFQVSGRLQGFLERLLVRDPLQRATAAELLQHPFLRQAGPPSLLVPLMRASAHTNC